MNAASELISLLICASLLVATLFFVAFLGARLPRKPRNTALQTTARTHNVPTPYTAPPAPPSHPALPYTRRHYLLSQAEREFFAVLDDVTPPDWHIFPQVRLANLVLVPKGTRNWQSHFNRVAAKCVDFVICDPDTVSPRLVIELDDASHDRPDRQARDQFVDAVLASAELPILHVRWQRTYDTARLKAQVYAALGVDLPTPTSPSPQLPPAPVQMAIGLPPAAAPAAASAIPLVQRWACRRCAAPVSADATFCPECGTRLELKA